MKRALILVALIAAGTAMAQNMIFKQGILTVRLTLEACQLEPIAQALVTAGGLTEPKAVAVTHGSSELRGCWSLDKDSDVLIGDESGTTGYIPMAAFKPSPGI